MALTTTEEALVRQLLEQQAAILSLAESESTIISKLGATKVTIADLASASSIDDSDLFLIRQGATEKNVSGAVVKELASASVDGATETSAGIVELATAAETQTGTDNSRAVHPAGLASLTATESRAGLIEIATDSEAQSFSANKAIDGAKLNSALKGANQSLSTNGYQKLPGGLIIQWGRGTTTISPGASLNITMPISMTAGVGYVNFSIIGTGGANNALSVPLVVANTLSNINVTNTDVDSSITQYHWFAIGW